MKNIKRIFSLILLLFIVYLLFYFVEVKSHGQLKLGFFNKNYAFNFNILSYFTRVKSFSMYNFLQMSFFLILNFLASLFLYINDLHKKIKLWQLFFIELCFVELLKAFVSSWPVSIDLFTWILFAIGFTLGFLLSVVFVNVMQIFILGIKNKKQTI